MVHRINPLVESNFWDDFYTSLYGFMDSLNQKPTDFHIGYNPDHPTGPVIWFYDTPIIAGKFNEGLDPQKIIFECHLNDLAFFDKLEQALITRKPINQP